MVSWVCASLALTNAMLQALVFENELVRTIYDDRVQHACLARRGAQLFANWGPLVEDPVTWYWSIL